MRCFRGWEEKRFGRDSRSGVAVEKAGVCIFAVGFRTVKIRRDLNERGDRRVMVVQVACGSRRDMKQSAARPSLSDFENGAYGNKWSTAAVRCIDGASLSTSE